MARRKESDPASRERARSYTGPFLRRGGWGVGALLVSTPSSLMSKSTKIHAPPSLDGAHDRTRVFTVLEIFSPRHSNTLALSASQHAPSQQLLHFYATGTSVRSVRPHIRDTRVQWGLPPHATAVAKPHFLPATPHPKTRKEHTAVYSNYRVRKSVTRTMGAKKNLHLHRECKMAAS